MCLTVLVDKSDLEFLKYLVSNHSVDVNGELWKYIAHVYNYSPLIIIVHLIVYVHRVYLG